MNVQEGDKSNDIVYNSAGELYINGEETTIEESNLTHEDSEANEGGDIVANGAVSNTFTCPYGKAGDYTKAAGTQIYNVELVAGAVTLGAIVVGVAIAILCPVVFASIATTCATAIVGYCVSTNINPKWISTKVANKVHKTKGFNVTKNKSVHKRVKTVYFKKNAQGSKKKSLKTSYRVFMY